MKRIICFFICIVMFFVCFACIRMEPLDTSNDNNGDTELPVDTEGVNGSLSSSPIATESPLITDVPELTFVLETPDVNENVTAAPTANASDIEFIESKSLPLPSENEDIPHGQPFCFGGIVKSDNPIIFVAAVIEAESGILYDYSVSFAAGEGVKSVELMDPTFSKSGETLTEKIQFEKLACGEYKFYLYAEDTESGRVLIKTTSFQITKNTWNTIITNNFRNNYEYVLEFFGSRDEFIFDYKWGEGRNIEIEKSWANSHMVYVTAPNGKNWIVHKKAKPNYELAFEYLTSSYVHVGGTYDSGIICLYDLVEQYGGTFVSRFVTDRTFVSHHSLGTAVDLNHTMDANLNVLENRNIIFTEVHDNLKYNGIKEANGIKYYDFEYVGNWSNTFQDVPTTIINYLLYELAFYRADFGWGYYYSYACDGMHFSVSEMDPDIHNVSERSLRKVYSYID